jgi:small subunit ribosomal protein S6
MYEAMFVFEPTSGSNWQHVEEEIQRLMTRADAELIRMKKWDERRLAYEVNGIKRGVYVLTFFMAPTDKIVGLERDVQLSEEILRVLVLSRSGYSIDQVNEIVDKSEPIQMMGRDEYPAPVSRTPNIVEIPEEPELADETILNEKSL